MSIRDLWDNNLSVLVAQRADALQRCLVDSERDSLCPLGEPAPPESSREPVESRQVHDPPPDLGVSSSQVVADPSSAGSQSFPTQNGGGQM